MNQTSSYQMVVENGDESHGIESVKHNLKKKIQEQRDPYAASMEYLPPLHSA